ncbi:MAG: endonuclease/exonuclease/phosphatase family protein, partial [Ignavibacteriae bacterium]|nr:endonuclease/exonuclease/phosphatase family protein [Ignavibacteriota bacterium]
MNNRKKILLLIILISGSTIFGQEQFRVMTYNVLNYPSKISSTRNPYFAKVIEAVNPDILIVQEMESITGVTMFHEDVLDSSYSAGAFINGNDTDNALFYKDSVFDFIDNTPIKTALRDIAQLTLVYKNSGDTLIIYSAHLKASDGATNEQKRLAEVNNLRAVTDKLSPNMNYMLVGDFNFYNSTEPGFQKLLDKTKPGYFLDPINKIANWHNNSIYRSIHTQSTRLTSLSDEGSTGGLDDRFDMILVSQAVIDSGSITYLPNSYTTFGNDGNHFNRALIELPNATVSNDIATALYYASDHLPVYADFVLEPLTSIKDDEAELIIDDFELFQNYP